MADDRSTSDPTAEIERVGYGRPPRATRFRKGVSGNPKGRPKGARNLTTVVGSALNEQVTISENGRKRRISKLEAAVKQLVNRAASGEARAMALLLTLVQAGEARAADTQPPEFEDGDADAMRELMRRLGREDLA